MSSFALYFTVKVAEYNTDATKAITKLSAKVYGAAAPTKYCTFTWDATSKLYNSTCCSA